MKNGHHASLGFKIYRVEYREKKYGKYRISGNFCKDLIFTFFTMSQNFEYAEIIICIIFDKKLFKSQI